MFDGVGAAAVPGRMKFSGGGNRGMGPESLIIDESGPKDKGQKPPVGLSHLVGGARFELATNGLKVLAVKRGCS